LNLGVASCLLPWLFLAGGQESYHLPSWDKERQILQSDERTLVERIAEKTSSNNTTTG
jgi:hypothetical protein